MRMKTQRILAALLSLVLLLALAPAGWAVDVTTPNIVNINLVPTDKEGTDFATDIVKAKVQADLYLIAPAVADEQYDTYGYNFEGSTFAGLKDSVTAALKTDPAEKTTYEIMLKSFSRIAQAAAEIVKNGDMDPDYYQVAATDVSTIELGGIQAGLYLLILRGNDFTNKIDTEEGEEGYFTTTVKEGGGQSGEYSNPDEPTDPDAKKPDVTITVTRARSNNYEFLFEPQIISLPTKMEGNDPTYNTAYGAWSTTLSLTAKPEMNPRFGDLKIVKTLNTFAGPDPASFVFEIKWTDKTKDEVRYAELTFKDKGTEEYVLEKVIPVGTKVTVTEVHSGLQYSLTASDEMAKTVTIVSEKEITSGSAEIATAKFTNDHTGPGGGYGVTNRFTSDGTGNFTWQQLEDSRSPAADK